MSRRLPVPNEDSGPFWNACAEGRLQFQWCESCGELNWFPRRMCRSCHSDELRWRTVPGTGTIYTFSVVHRPPGPEFASPYVLALIDVNGGPRMMSHVIAVDPDNVWIGAAVAVEFERLSEAVTLPVFRLDGER